MCILLDWLRGGLVPVTIFGKVLIAFCTDAIRMLMAWKSFSWCGDLEGHGQGMPTGCACFGVAELGGREKELGRARAGLWAKRFPSCV